MKNKKIKLVKKSNYIYGSFRESLSYIAQSKNYIFSILILFLVFGFFGYFVSLPNNLYLALMNMIKNLVSQVEDLNVFELIGFIFINNLKASFFALFFGIVLGIFPLVVIMFNGFLVGFVAKISVANSDFGLWSLWRLLPHGIFELLAVFVSAGLGLKLGTVIFSKNIEKEMKNRIILSIKTFFFFVLPLLFIAAVIESILISFFS